MPRVAVALAAAHSSRVPELLGLLLAHRPSRRSVVVVGAVASVFAFTYALARQTPVFALSAVEVSGAPGPVAAEIREALRPLAGESLVALDPGEVEARLRRLPSVGDVAVDRAFPHTLAVSARSEEPLAVVRDGQQAWVVARSGRVMLDIPPHAKAHLPRIRVARAGPLAPGEKLTSSDTRSALVVLRAAPARFPVRILYARVRHGEVVLVAAGWVEVRIGSVAAAGRKLAAAAAVLESLSPSDRARAAYVDASLPRRVVVGSRKLESEGLGLADERAAN